MKAHRCARCNATRYVIGAALAALVVPVGALAQTISIDSGARWQITDANVDFDCASLAIGGTFDAQDGTVGGIGDLDFAGKIAATGATFDIGGNWNNHGNFVAGASTVRFVDRCGAAQAQISGSTNFANLVVDSARAKMYRFAAGLSQGVAQNLHLAGAPGQLLTIRSTQPGVRAGIALAASGNQQIAWVDVADMEAPPGSAELAPGPPAAFNSVDSGNNVRWFALNPAALPTSVPALSTWALVALGLLLGLLGRRRLCRT